VHAQNVVNVDYDKNANFSSYSTYARTKGTPVSNQLMDQRIIEGIDNQLADRGLRKVNASAKPDLSVLYHGAVETETQLNTTNIGGWGWRWGTGMSTTTVDTIPTERLVVKSATPRRKNFCG
jgi:Domain of unknown function (DUF4136)